MAKGRERPTGRTTPKGTRPSVGGPGQVRQPAGPRGESDFIDEVAGQLATGQPLDLLAQVSSLIAVFDRRSRDPFTSRDEEDDAPSLGQLIAAFGELQLRETTALLAGIACLAGDELLRARARRHLARRDHELPGWLSRLGQASVHRALEMGHVLGDGHNIVVGVHLPEGHELTAVVYVDQNLGTVAKDAVVVPVPVEEVVALMKAQDTTPQDTLWRELDLPDARARITDAVDRGARMFPPLESDTWPACRPLVEWVARLLPEGGVGYGRPEWDDAAKRALTESFFVSEFGRSLDDEDHRDLFESFLWFGTDCGPGDPLHWSPPAVEILLSDWIPRKIMAPASFLSKAPRLLRAFIRYAHRERGIRPGLTAETLEAVDIFEPEDRELIRSPRPQGPAALISAMATFDPGGPWSLSGDSVDPWDDEDDEYGDEELWEDELDDFYEPYDFKASLLDRLRDEVGGEQALKNLDDRPLADEPFPWEGIPADIHPKVGEVLSLCDRYCDELLDQEYRTACRRFLKRAATGNPEVFRRKGRADTAAAAICWAIGKDNDLFSPSGGGMLAKDLASHFGVSQGNLSQRASTLIRAAGIPLEYSYRWSVRYPSLGTPELLVSSRRREIIELRDQYAETG